jgi:predicted GH43/DUF377 family glycosyl hydrolase
MLSLTRSPNNPFLTPSRINAFEAMGAFNPSVVKEDNTLHVFYRAMAEPDELRTPGRGFSTIGYMSSQGDESFNGRTQIISAIEPWESYGCEDPRATFFEGKWYVFYTALGGFPFSADNIKVAVAIGNSPTTLTEKHLVTPFNAKAATLFPERVNGQVILLLTAHTDRTDEYPSPIIGIARAENIEDFWTQEYWDEWHADIHAHAFPDVRRSDTEHMEIGAAPILTKDGWLLIYSHIQNYYDEHNRIFGVEALLLDVNDPHILHSKTEFPILVPEESYERYGIVSNIVFPTGAYVEDDTLHIFYGAADTVGAEAALNLPDLLYAMNHATRNSFMQRLGQGPILTPDPSHAWESTYTFNAASLEIDRVIYLLYRAMGSDGISRMGYASTRDGVTIDERLDEPVYGPRIEEERFGTEDPRLTQIGDLIYLFYTAFDGSRARGAYSTISVDDFISQDFNWSMPTLITPEYVNDKDVALVPEPVQGKTMIIHRIDPNLCVEFFDGFPNIGMVSQSIELMLPRPGMWDGMKIGISGTPIRVDEGWLCIYHGVGPDHAYRLGAALIDAGTGMKILGRTALPILEPVTDWEKKGQVHNVIFSCGAILRDDILFIYYGGGDSATGVATVSKTELITRLIPKI